MTNYQVTDNRGQVHRRTVSSLSSRTYTHAVVVHYGEYPAYGPQPPRAAFSRAEWHTTPALAERNAARWRARLGARIIGVEIVAVTEFGSSALALQLLFCFEVRSLSERLVSSTPE